MILSDSGIKEALRTEQTTITPTPADKQYDTSSLDLRLGSQFRRYREDLVSQSGVRTVVDPESFDYQNLARAYMEEVPSSEEDGSIEIKPDEFILAITRETIHLPERSKIAARIEGRSTLARIGLSVHVTAPTIQLGFQGKLVLEIKNHGELGIKLNPGMSICQLVCERVGESTSSQIGTEHQGQTDLHGGRQN